MTAGSKIKDTKQEERYTQVFTYPDGSTFQVYSTPDNQRMVMEHSSGSHMEFKADGTVYIRAVKDLHLLSSVASSQTNSLMGADTTTQRQDTDLALEVAGKLSIKCASLDLEVGSTARCKAGTDFIISGNNIIEKATESISLEGQKSVYIDAKEIKERSVYKTANIGNAEDTGQGGVNVMNVFGNAVIRNSDPRGGITLEAAGYLNLVCGQERVDVIGQYPLPLPSALATSTFTTVVKAPTPLMPTNKSTSPGDIGVTASSGAAYTYLGVPASSSLNKAATLTTTVMAGNEMQVVSVGDRIREVGGLETVTIVGTQTITAAQIFLN